MFSSSNTGSDQIVFVSWKNGCSTGWVGVSVLRELLYVACTMRGKKARYRSHVPVVVDKPPLRTHQRRTDIQRCLSLCPYVCVLDKERESSQEEEAHEIFQRPRNTGVNRIPTSIDYLSTGWRVCRFMLTYKQSRDRLAPL